MYDKKAKLKEPILLVGLPGIGNVGNLVVEHIRRELNAKKYATLRSPHFPHQTIMLKNGSMRLVNNRFYHCKNKNGKSLILLVGDAQAGGPKGQYIVNDRIVRFFKKIGGKQVYTIGGYSAGNNYVQNPRVFGVSTSKTNRENLSKNGVIFGQAAGSIWGSAGIIPVFANDYGIPSACIMGETGMLEIDANAAKAVLELLKNILNIDIKLDNLERIKKETEKILKNIEEASKEQGDQQTPGYKSNENLSYIR
jgi:uncharacterized protein (TIGR00162 family)